MKTATKDIVVGIFYELPDGRIAFTYGFSDPRQTVSYYFDDDNGSHSVSFTDLATWKPRRDLADFPNARDPRLPYVFDLYWDMKYKSELVRAIENDHDDIDQIRAAMQTHNIVI